MCIIKIYFPDGVPINLETKEQVSSMSIIKKKIVKINYGEIDGKYICVLTLE